MLLTGVTTPTHSNWQFTDDQIPLHSHRPVFLLGQKTVMGSIVGGLGPGVTLRLKTTITKLAVVAEQSKSLIKNV